MDIRKLDKLDRDYDRLIDETLERMTDEQLEQIVHAGGYNPIWDRFTDEELQAIADGDIETFHRVQREMMAAGDAAEPDSSTTDNENEIDRYGGITNEQ